MIAILEKAPAKQVSTLGSDMQEQNITVHTEGWQLKLQARSEKNTRIKK
jgi:hypothetical protein